MARKQRERTYVDVCREHYESIPDQSISFADYLNYVDATIININEQILYGTDIFIAREAIDLNSARELYDSLAALRAAYTRIHKNIQKRIEKEAMRAGGEGS